MSLVVGIVHDIVDGKIALGGQDRVVRRAERWDERTGVPGGGHGGRGDMTSERRMVGNKRIKRSRVTDVFIIIVGTEIRHVAVGLSGVTK